MASLRHLSDKELRKELQSYGINSPVTASSREILLKALNHAKKSSKGRSNSQSRGAVKSTTPTRLHLETKSKNPERSLINFSSDEDDIDYDTPTSGRTLRRSLRNSTESSTKNIRRRRPATPANESSPSDKNISPFSFSHLKAPGKSKTPLHSTLKSNYDTGSDSDIDSTQDSVGKFTNIPSNSWRENIQQPEYQYKNFSKGFDTRIRNSHFPLLIPSSDTKNRWERKNTRLTPPILKESDITSPDDVVSHESLSLQNNSIPNGKATIDHNDSSSFDSDEGNLVQSVPLFLLVLLAIFFFLLILCYVNIHTPLLPALQGFPMTWINSINFFNYKPRMIESEGSLDESEHEVFNTPNPEDPNIFPVCEKESTIDCLTGKEFSDVQDIIPLLTSTIIPALHEQAGLYQCGDSPHYYLSLQKVGRIIKKSFSSHVDDAEIADGLNGLGKLARLNPHWGLDPIWEKGMEEYDNLELLGFATSSQPTEILCHVTRAFYGILWFVVGILVICVAAWISFQIFRFYIKRSEEIEQRSFEFVEKILEVLENSCGTEGKEYIAVNHVRDCLIPPRERKLKAEVWSRAVSFIDNHDSRVYREVRQVGGEECEVWRWVSGAPRSPIACQPKTALNSEDVENQSIDKVWQGKAFENQMSNQSIPAISPTSCLKIRNMFDSELEFGDEWPRRIQDSLLEKCEGIKIVHVAVDRASKEGCVYLKCSSTKEAGKAYRSLHGWWFDRHLVTVKFLRDERYHERFPTARNAVSPITPSNNDRLSLQSSQLSAEEYIK